MNIQISMSAGTNPARLETRSVGSDAGALAETISVSRASKEISSLEQKGTQVSAGQEELMRRIEKAVKILEGPQTTLNISIHEKTHEIMVKVLNKETGEIIREVPNEKTLDLVAKMMELAGVIIDERI